MSAAVRSRVTQKLRRPSRPMWLSRWWARARQLQHAAEARLRRFLFYAERPSWRFHLHWEWRHGGGVTIRSSISTMRLSHLAAPIGPSSRSELCRPVDLRIEPTSWLILSSRVGFAGRVRAYSSATRLQLRLRVIGCGVFAGGNEKVCNVYTPDWGYLSTQLPSWVKRFETEIIPLIK